MGMTPALLPSPFLGPAVWEPVVAELRENHGVTAVVPRVPVPAAAHPAEVLAAMRDHP